VKAAMGRGVEGQEVACGEVRVEVTGRVEEKVLTLCRVGREKGMGG